MVAPTIPRRDQASVQRARPRDAASRRWSSQVSPPGYRDGSTDKRRVTEGLSSRSYGSSQTGSVWAGRAFFELSAPEILGCGSVFRWLAFDRNMGFNFPTGLFDDTSVAIRAQASLASNGQRSGALGAARGRKVADHLHDRPYVFDGGFGEDAVSQIEDMAGPSACPAQDVLDLPLELRQRREQGDGV